MLSILVADDDDVDRRRVRRALREAALDCEIAEVSSVSEMHAACEERRFDCAIIDYHMPGKNGLDGITELLSRAPTLPIVMVTGQGDEMIAREAMKLGAADYIPKANLASAALRLTIERALEKSALKQKLDLRQSELERFARVLAHDLSAPISSTCLVASMIKECAERDDTREIGGFCDQIIGLAESMGALIEELHAHTKFDDNAAFAPCDVGDALADALRNLSAAITKSGAQVSHGTLPEIVASAPQITQLLQNLIGNGLKYCEASRPKLRIEAERITGAWRFSVADNGIGVPSEYREQIFKPFERLHGAGQYAGTGLGLATCSKIVERHGGAIWCEAADAGGSVFFFTSPDAPRSTTG